MSIYKNRRKIAIAVLIPIILLLFLFLHFKIWSGDYIEGDLESVVVQYMESFKRGRAEENVKMTDESLHLFDYVYLSGTGINACLLYICWTGICLVYNFLRPSITLCSLSVRMND